MLAAVEIDVRLLPKIHHYATGPGFGCILCSDLKQLCFSDIECVFDGIAMKNVNIIKSMRNGITEM